MEVEKNDILKVIKTLNSIEVHGEQNLSMLYASITFLNNMISKETPSAEVNKTE